MYATEKGILNEQMKAARALSKNAALTSKLLLIEHLKPEFGKDGDMYYYIIGKLPEPDCIVGFGETPMIALNNFCQAYGL